MTIPEFHDEPYMTATEKQQVFKAWSRFLKGGLKRSQFTTALYRHLHVHLPFIAHFDLNGFHSTYFECGDDTVRFFRTLRDFIDGSMAHLRSPGYQDINRALITELDRFEPALVACAKAKQKAADLAAAQALLTKHGLSLPAESGRPAGTINGAGPG